MSDPNLPPGCTAEDIDNAWGTQFPVDQRDPDAWEENYEPEDSNAE